MEKNIEKISIIIPVYNCAHLLPKCLDSVLAQTFRNLEIILVENNSTDDSLGVCEEYARRDSRIRILHAAKQGPSCARNVGIDAATAPLISFVDSDDYIEPQMMQRLYDWMHLTGADMACCGYVCEPSSNYETNMPPYPTIVMNREEAVATILGLGITSSPWAKLFRRELFDGIRFPEGRYFEDHAIMHLVAAQCTKMVWFNEALYHYVQNDASICHSLTPEKYFHFFLADNDRLQFVRRSQRLLGDNYRYFLNMEAKRCFKHFRMFMRVKSSYRGRQEQKEQMRRMLAEYTGIKGLKPTIEGNLIMARLFFPLFYLIHIAFRRKELAEK